MANSLIIKIDGDAKPLEKALDNVDKTVKKRKTWEEYAKESGKSFDEIEKDVKNLAQEFQKQGDSIPLSYKKAYADIGISSKRSMTDAETDMENASKKAKKEAPKVSEKYESAFDDVSTMAKKSLAAVTVGVGAITTALIASAEMTREYREEMNKLDTAFTSAGKTVEQGEQVFKDFYGILGETDQSVEAVSHLAELTNNQEELSKWTDISAGVLAKFGDSLPLEGLTEAASVSATLGQVTGPLTDAFEFAGVTVDDFNKELESMSTQEERATAITEKLSEIYGETGETFRETNETIIEGRENQLELQDSMAKVGEQVDILKNEFLNKLLPVFEPLLEYVSEFIENFDLEETIQSVKDFYDNLQPWLPLLAGVTAAFVVLLTAIKIASFIQAVSAAFGVLNAVMAANPILAVVMILAALVAAFITAYKTSDKFRAVVDGVFGKIKQVVSNVIDAMVGFFTKTLPNAFKSAINFVITGINAYIKALNFMIRGIASLISSVINIVVGGINLMIKAALLPLNLLIAGINKIPGVKVAKVGFEIPSVPNFGDSVFQIPSVPKLAKGGVIPPNSEFLAILGDQKSGTNIEAPLDTIKQALSEVLAGVNSSVGGLITSSVGSQSQPVASSISNYKTSDSNKQGDVYLDGKKVGVIVSQTVNKTFSKFSNLEKVGAF